MAVVVASTSTHTGSTVAGTAIAVTKPTGLAAGDMLVAFLYGARSTAGWGTPAGWTKLQDASKTDGTDANMSVVVKIADSGDAAATDFTFTPDSATEEKIGVLLRVTGNFSVAVGSLVVSNFANNQNGAPASMNSPVTPISVNSLLLIGGSNARASSQASFSGYAVANNNPGTWTSIFDGNTNNGTIFCTGGLASGAYTASGSTGNVSLGAAEAFGMIIVGINEVVDVSMSPAVITMTASVQAPTIAGGASISPAVITMTASVQAPTVTTAAPDWVNQSKSSAPSWSNQSKS